MRFSRLPLAAAPGGVGSMKRFGVVVALLLSVGAASASAQGASTCFKRTPTIVGTEGEDELYGGNETDVIDALGGPDIIGDPGGSDDFICGGGGVDRLMYSERGRVVANLSTGVATGQDGSTDRLRNIENLILADDGVRASFTGDGLPNHLAGNILADRLAGKGGNDLLEGGGGGDTYFGGDGNDTISAPSSEGDVIQGGPGDDDINSAGGGAAYVDGGPGHDHCAFDVKDTVVNCET